MIAPLTAADDRSLLQRVAMGDATAVRSVIDRYGSLVWSIARRFDPGDAEDAVQDIFLDVWKHAARFDPAVSTETTFVAMIARRRVIDRRRRKTLRERTITKVATIAMLEPPGPDRGAEAALVARCFDQLSVDQRTVLVLAICEGMTHTEIAARLATPLGTVKAHARRGLLAMRAAAMLNDEEHV